MADLNEIIDCLTNGWPLPAEFYRRNIGRDRDRLLAETGVKHLHLGGNGSDHILYLIEFPEKVVLLDLNGHVHLEDEPRGKFFRRLLGLAND